MAPALSGLLFVLPQGHLLTTNQINFFNFYLLSTNFFAPSRTSMVARKASHFLSNIPKKPQPLSESPAYLMRPIFGSVGEGDQSETISSDILIWESRSYRSQLSFSYHPQSSYMIRDTHEQSRGSKKLIRLITTLVVCREQPDLVRTWRHKSAIFWVFHIRRVSFINYPRSGPQPNVRPEGERIDFSKTTRLSLIPFDCSIQLNSNSLGRQLKVTKYFIIFWVKIYSWAHADRLQEWKRTTAVTPTPRPTQGTHQFRASSPNFKANHKNQSIILRVGGLTAILSRGVLLRFLR